MDGWMDGWMDDGWMDDGTVRGVIVLNDTQLNIRLTDFSDFMT